jgi:hypothetical protein
MESQWDQERASDAAAKADYLTTYGRERPY